MPQFIAIPFLAAAAEIALNIGLALISNAITQAGLPDAEVGASALKQSRPPRRSGYGRRRLGGYWALYAVDSNGWFRGVLALHDGLIVTPPIAYYLNDDIVTLSDPYGGGVQQGADGRYGGGDNVYIGFRDGHTPETPHGDIEAALPSIWTSDHRGDGVASLALSCRPKKASYFQTVYPNGIPSPSAVCDLQLCWDPRLGTDRTVRAFTENPVLHRLDYLLNRRGVDYDTEIDPAIDLWKAAADDCDDATDLKAGGTEPRYRGCVLYDHNNEPADITAAMLATFDGWEARRQDGAIAIYSGRYYEPTVTAGPDEIVSYTIKSFVSDDEAVNELIVTYISAAHDYNEVETDAWRDEDDITARGGKVLSQQFSVQSPSYSQNRRLAKRKMAQANATLHGTCSTNSGGRRLMGERYVNLSIIEAGETFFSGPAEILKMERDFGSGGVTFDWVSADANVDDWIPALEEGDPAPTGDRVAGAALDPPVITDATAFLEATGDGGNGVGIRLAVTGPIRDDATWFTRWRPLGATNWDESEDTDQDAGDPILLEHRYVAANTTVEAEVAVALGDGRKSDWSTTATIDTSVTGSSFEIALEGVGHLLAETGDILSTET